MSEYTGNNLYLLWNGNSVAGDYRNFNPTESMGLEDGSAGSDAAVTRKTTLKDGSATLEMVAQAGGTAQWAYYVPGSEGTLEWGPEGTASNKPRHYVNAIVESRNQVHAYNGITLWNVTWQYSGALTDTNY